MVQLVAMRIKVLNPMSSPDGEVHLSYQRGKASKRGEGLIYSDAGMTRKLNQVSTG
jgi:hypothetical protein